MVSSSPLEAVHILISVLPTHLQLALLHSMLNALCLTL